MTVLRTSGSLGRSTSTLAPTSCSKSVSSEATVGRARFKRRILPKHRLLELPQRQAGFDPELLDEQRLVSL